MFCSVCAGSPEDSGCVCALRPEDYIEEFPELIKCIEGARETSVFNAIEIGDRLFLVKDAVKAQGGSWVEFMKQNFDLGVRTCQNYMQLSKTPIHKNHYKLGIDPILKLLRKGIDLSNPTIE